MVPQAEPDRVHHAFALVVQHLGGTFSLPELVTFTAACRGKELRIEPERARQEAMPVSVTGTCVALQDVDLIVTRRGLDAILCHAVVLHEIGHLLLAHIPRLSAGTSTPTYQVFQRRRTSLGAVCRTPSATYADPRERDAETLATLLLGCIRREAEALPHMVQDVLGWTKEA